MTDCWKTKKMKRRWGANEKRVDSYPVFHANIPNVQQARYSCMQVLGPGPRIQDPGARSQEPGFEVQEIKKQKAQI